MLVKRLWIFFCSIRLTLYLLLLLVLFLFLGSGQMTRQVPELSLLGQVSLLKWFTAVGQKSLTVTYWLWMSFLCIFLLALNTIACTIDRLIVLFGTQLRAKTDVNENFLSNLRISFTLSSQESAEDILSKAKSLFRKNRYRIAERKNTGGWVLFGHRGRISLLGPHVAHLGFLLFLLGHLISFFINEKSYGFRLYEHEPKTIAHANNASLRLENISFEYDAASGRLVDYESRLSVLLGGRKVQETVIGPNRPLFYEGQVFYQGPYGKESTHLELLLQGDKQQSPISFSVAIEGETSIPGTNLKLGLGQLVPDFYISPMGEISSQSTQMNNPAIPVFLYRRGELINQGWFFLYNPNFKIISGKGYKIRLVNSRGRIYLDLDIVRNPGAFYALLGSIFLMIGLFTGFLSSHRRLWLICSKQGDGEIFRFGGLTSRNKDAFARHTNRLYQQLDT